MKAGLPVFIAIGALWPESWDTYMVDFEYYEEKIPFDQIKVPTIMVHGDCDDDINYSNSLNAHKGIEGSILITQKNGSHSCQFHEDYTAHFDTSMEFAKKHLGLKYDEEILNKQH